MYPENRSIISGPDIDAQDTVEQKKCYMGADEPWDIALLYKDIEHHLSEPTELRLSDFQPVYQATTDLRAVLTPWIKVELSNMIAAHRQ